MRRVTPLAIAALLGALGGAAGTYLVVREPTSAVTDRQASPPRPPADMIDSEHGLELCRSAGSRGIPGDNPRLLAAYDTTAREYAAWTLDGRPYEPLAANNFVAEKISVSPDTPLTVCYFDSEEAFAISTPPPHRARVLVDGFGGSFTEAIGNRDSLDVTRPGAGPYFSEPD